MIFDTGFIFLDTAAPQIRRGLLWSGLEVRLHAELMRQLIGSNPCNRENQDEFDVKGGDGLRFAALITSAAILVIEC